MRLATPARDPPPPSRGVQAPRKHSGPELATEAEVQEQNGGQGKRRDDHDHYSEGAQALSESDTVGI